MAFFKPGESVVFKGCTRPACLMGVPMLPAVVMFGSFVLVAVWTNIVPLMVLSIPIFFVMRVMTKDDDQQFNQMGVRLRTRRKNRNSKFWGNACSYQPCSYTRKLK